MENKGENQASTCLRYTSTYPSVHTGLGQFRTLCIPRTTFELIVILLPQPTKCRGYQREPLLLSGFCIWVTDNPNNFTKSKEDGREGSRHVGSNDPENMHGTKHLVAQTLLPRRLHAIMAHMSLTLESIQLYMKHWRYHSVTHHALQLSAILVNENTFFSLTESI